MSQTLPDHVAIEIYEWKAGAPRPGSKSKPRNNCIDLMNVPTGHPLPHQGDVLQLRMPGDPKADLMGFVAYVVLEREFVAWRGAVRDTFKDDPSTPLVLKKMWIHVRQLEDYSLPAAVT